MHHQFRSDYIELADKRILDALSKYSLEQNIPYGFDYHSENASKYILNTFGSAEGRVYFLEGGTQTNLLFISYCLKHYEGVIAADTGHINVHESAAVEGSGYKILTVPNRNGKIYPEQIKELLEKNNDVHTVKPRMIYISNSTETGTIYSKKEIIDLYEFAKTNKLYLFIDGARLGSALTSKENDLEKTDLGKYCDAFYVGGTKNGLLFGEALVVNNQDLQIDFYNHIKNKGAMLAKGYALGIQFEEAFKDNLYFELAAHANEMASLVKAGLTKIGVEIYPSPTNQLFISLPRDIALKLIEVFGLEKWIDNGDMMVVRIVTSFSTTKEDVDDLINYIKELL